MKKLLLLISAISFSNFSFSQNIDWNSYKDPDGDYKRLLLNPEINYVSRTNENEDFNSFSVNLNNFYRLDKVRELSLFRISSFNDIGYNSISRGAIGGDESVLFRRSD